MPVTPGVEPIGGRCDQIGHWVRNRAHQTLRGIADLGELALSGLKLLNELLKLQKLVGDHRPLVAVHHRPQNEPDQEFIRAGDAEDAEGRDGRGQRKEGGGGGGGGTENLHSATDSVHQQTVRGGCMRRSLVDPAHRSLATF